MKLKVLVDNNTYIDEYYLGEPAISYYIEDGNQKIIFDVGYSNVYIKNAAAMGIDLNSIDTIVLSHGHNDHTGGLQYYPKFKDKKIKLVAHPNVFENKKDNNLIISSPLSKVEASSKFDLNLYSEPKKISDNIIYLGEIERITNFENKFPVGKRYIDGEWKPDYLLDDSAIVYQSNEGLYIITGCSHSGICNIIEYAKKVCKDTRVKGIIGGFHLFHNSEQLVKTITYLKDIGVEALYPCHCTSFEAKAIIHEKIKLTDVGVGLSLEW